MAVVSIQQINIRLQHQLQKQYRYVPGHFRFPLHKASTSFVASFIGTGQGRQHPIITLRLTQNPGTVQLALRLIALRITQSILFIKRHTIAVPRRITHTIFIACKTRHMQITDKTLTVMRKTHHTARLGFIAVMVILPFTAVHLQIHQNAARSFIHHSATLNMGSRIIHLIIISPRNRHPAAQQQRTARQSTQKLLHKFTSKQQATHFRRSAGKKGSTTY